MRDHDLLFFAGAGPTRAFSLPVLLLFGAFEPRSETLSQPGEIVSPFLRTLGNIQR
jgi:hypothetical protein